MSNTPPAALLEVGQDDVQKVRGDSLGSFWMLTPAALKHARTVSAAHHDHVAKEVRREAYSWGQMARNSTTAPGGASNAWVQRASRAGWMLLVPLGLANTAYWSRRLSRDPKKFARGAGPIRVFGLGLTLLVVMAFSTVALDLVATQCFATTGSACPSRPGFLATLETFTWTQRLAVMSFVPVAVLLLLLWLSAGSRVRYEQAMPGTTHSGGDAAQGGPTESAGAGEAGHPWTLAHADLWSRWSLTNAMAQLHVAAGLGVVLMVLAAAHAWGSHPDCRDLHDLIENVPACAVDLVHGTQQASVALLVGGVVVEGVAVYLVWRAQHLTMHSSTAGNRYRAWTRGVLVAAVLLFLAEVVLLAIPGTESTDETLIGLSFFPAAVVVVLLLIALVATTWRAARSRTALAVVGALLLAVPLWYWAVKQWPGSAEPPSWTLLVAAGAGIVLIVATAFGWRLRAPAPGSPDPKVEGWRGMAPAVLLVLSLGSVVMLTSLVVVAAGDWLNGNAPVPCLDQDYAPAQQQVCTPQEGGRLVLPPMYPLFTVALPVGLALSAAAIIAGALVRVTPLGRRSATDVSEAETGEPADALTSALREDYDRQQLAGTLTTLLDRDDLLDSRQRTRRLAAAAKYSERVLGAVAMAFAIALIAMVLVSVDPTGLDVPAASIALLTFVGIWGTALLWTTLLIRVVTKPSGQRPAGLLWDLICFLPRSAHPFGPPCYAERVVPELAGRVSSWLDDDSVAPEDRERRVVVLSAHSLGAVLAVATLFSRPPDKDRRRVALLTYGSQLRPYFGRFFPELLGPQVLGTDACRAPRLVDRTPWPVPPDYSTRVRPGAPLGSGIAPLAERGPDEAARTLVAMLRSPGSAEPAWINLWRATDPLGMPAASDVPNYIDRAAEELDATAFVATVGTHGGYPRTTAYQRAFREVVARLGAPPPPDTRAVQTPGGGG
ncbi:hypothetical protein [Cellulomonas sp. P5_C5]